MYVPDMDAILDRYAAYWQMENHDRPLMSVCARKSGAKPVEIPWHDDPKQNWWDTERVIQRARSHMAATYYAGEAFPALNPNLGPDVFAAFLGAELVYESMETTWSVNFVEDWDDHQLRFDENNPYWRKIVEMTDAFLDDAHGDYLVGITDIHQSLDCLVSIRGAENVCLDLYDCPGKVRNALAQVETAFREVIGRSYALIRKKQRGMTNWMGIYHPDAWYVSSMDFLYLISPAMFDAFAGPCCRADAKIIGPNIFHLDGIGSLNHLDKLLAMPEIHGIQWVYGAGQPTAAHWIDVLRRVQDAGKLVTVAAAPDDFPALLNAGLKPEGLHYWVDCETEAQADRLIRDVEDVYRKKVY